MIELALFYLLISLGYLIGRRFEVERRAMIALLYILMPLLILEAISINAGAFLSAIPLVFAAFGLTIFASYIGARIALADYEPEKRVTLTLTAIRPNALFLPLAVSILVGLPDEAIVTIFAFSLAFNVFQPLVTPLVVAEISKRRAKRGLRLPTLRAAIVATILGLAGYPVRLPGYALLKLGVSYGSFIYVGLRLSKAPRPDSSIVRVAAVRFLRAPAFAYTTIMLLAPLGRPEKYVFLIEIASAPAVSNVIYARYFGLSPDAASKAVTYLNALGALLDYILYVALA